MTEEMTVESVRADQARVAELLDEAKEAERTQWYLERQETMAWKVERKNILQALHHRLLAAVPFLLAELQAAQDAYEHAAALKSGRKGQVGLGEIKQCYSIVCAKCQRWLTSYRSSSGFVAEDLEEAGWNVVLGKGWVCPKCAKKVKSSA